MQKCVNTKPPGDMAKTTHTISELAKEFDITTRTIRFYEDQGLLHPERHGRNRVYLPADVMASFDPDGVALSNLNTPEDLALAERLLNARG